MTKTLNFQWIRFNHFDIRILNLFRVSDFGFKRLTNPSNFAKLKATLTPLCILKIAPSSLLHFEI